MGGASSSGHLRVWVFNGQHGRPSPGVTKRQLDVAIWDAGGDQTAVRVNYSGLCVVLFSLMDTHSALGHTKSELSFITHLRHNFGTYHTLLLRRTHKLEQKISSALNTNVL